MITLEINGNEMHFQVIHNHYEDCHGVCSRIVKLMLLLYNSRLFVD